MNWALTDTNTNWCVVIGVLVAALAVVGLLGSQRDKNLALGAFVVAQLTIGAAAWFVGQPPLIVAPPLILASLGAASWGASANWLKAAAHSVGARLSARWAWLALAAMSPLAALGWAHYAESRSSRWVQLMHALMDNAAAGCHPTSLQARLDNERPIYLSPGVATLLPDEQQKSFETGVLRRWQLAGRLIRLAPAPPQCNCHGWVFTDGRYPLSGNDVEVILASNGYNPVDSPHVGDLVIYRDPAGVIMHTGVVHTVVADNAAALVESLWINLGRYLHAVDAYRFYDARPTFYRSARTGHVLAGLEHAPAPEAQPITAATSILADNLPGGPAPQSRTAVVAKIQMPAVSPNPFHD